MAGVGRRKACRTVGAGAALVLAASSVLIPPASAIATAPLPGPPLIIPWSPPHEVDTAPTGSLLVSCVGASWCESVDGGGYALAFRNGLWSIPVDIDGVVPLTGVSCASQTFCVATDSDNRALIFNGTNWSAPSTIDASDSDTFAALSCTVTGVAPGAPGFCAVVGSSRPSSREVPSGFAITYANSHWSAPTTIDPSSSLTSVSCASTEACTAVDANGNSMTFNGQSWSAPAPIDGSTAIDAVSCATTTTCVAVDANGAFVALSGGTWSSPRPAIHDGETLTDLSCASASFCGAVAFSLNDPGNAVLFNGSIWSDSHAEVGENLSAISCPSAGSCVAVDDLGNAFTYASNPPPEGSPLLWELTNSGAVYPFGAAASVGEPATSAGGAPSWVAITATPDMGGYMAVDAAGTVLSYGDAGQYPLSGPVAGAVAGIASTFDGRGYWVATSTGQVLAGGDAHDFGSPAESSLTLRAPIVAIVATSDAQGYWLLGSDGGIFAYGDAGFYGSMGGVALAAPAVGMAPVAGGGGYWIIGSDGGVFSFGSAAFYGSGYLLQLTGGTASGSPVVLATDPVRGIVPTTDSKGYLLYTVDGVMLGFGDAWPSGVFTADLPANAANAPVTGMAGIS